MEEQFDQCTTALMTASEARSAEQARLRAARRAPQRSAAEGCLRERNKTDPNSSMENSPPKADKLFDQKTTPPDFSGGVFISTLSGVNQ